MIILEGRDGRPHLHDVGSGDSPRFSPDDQTIAFVLYPGESSGEPEGVWLMNADGTNRRRLCELAAPFWSPDGTQILLNGLLDPHDLEDLRSSRRNGPPGSTSRDSRSSPGRGGWRRARSWPASAGGSCRTPSSSWTSAGRRKRRWCGGSGIAGAASDVFARWPVLTSPSGDLYFIGDERDSAHACTPWLNTSPGGAVSPRSKSAARS